MNSPYSDSPKTVEKIQIAQEECLARYNRTVSELWNESKDSSFVYINNMAAIHLGAKVSVSEYYHFFLGEIKRSGDRFIFVQYNGKARAKDIIGSYSEEKFIESRKAIQAELSEYIDKINNDKKIEIIERKHSNYKEYTEYYCEIPLDNKNFIKGLAINLIKRFSAIMSK